MGIREHYQSKLKKSFLLTVAIFVICSIFVFNSQAIAQTPPLPDPPTGLTATAVSPTQINLAWTAPSNGASQITGYKIEYKTASGEYSVLVADTGIALNWVDAVFLAPSTTYTYRVSAIGNAGNSIPSNEATATTLASSMPDPPTGLSATAVSSSDVNLAWTAPSNNGGSPITGYEIEYKTASGEYSVLVANTANTVTSYAHGHLTPSTSYTYRVSAINSGGTGTPSNEATVTTPTSTLYPPYSPTGLSATAVSPTQINLAWTAPSNNGGSPITGYEIEYKTASGEYSVLVANTADTATSYSNTGLTPSTSYTYRVSAINSVGLTPSNEATATTLTTVPAAPTGLTATAVSPTQINLAWNPPTNNGGSPITGYKIEYKIGTGSYSLVTHTSNPLTYFSTGLAPSTSYTYRVSTDNVAGTSTPSNEATATTQSLVASVSSPPIPPQTPTPQPLQPAPSPSPQPSSDQSTIPQTQSGFPNYSNVSTMKISGKYSDPENGIQITFPDGWNGNLIHSVNVTAAMLTKNATEFMPSITFEIMDKSTLEKMVGTLENLANNVAFREAMMKSGKGCNVTPPTSITVNGMNGLQYVEQCPLSGQSFTIEMTMFETNKNFVSLLLMTTDFEKDRGDYNSALNSLNISNTVQVPFSDLTPVTPSPSPQSSSDQLTTTQTPLLSPQPSSSDKSTTTQTPSPSSQPSPFDQLTTIQTPSLTPQPSPRITFTVSTDKSSYSSGNTVTSTILFSGTNEKQNIAVDIIDKSGNIILSKPVTTDSKGTASLQFNLPQSAQSGSYQVVARSSYNGNSWGNSASFDLQQNGAPLSTGSAQKEQQGNFFSPSTGLGFLGGIMKFFNGLFHW